MSGAIQVTGWDSETALIRPGLLAPPLVCVTWQHRGDLEAGIVHHKDPACFRMLREWFEDAAAGKRQLVGQNHAFDAAVVCERFPDLREAVFGAYDNDGVTDTMIRQWLLDTAAGCLRGRINSKGLWIPYTYDLEALARRALDMRLQKDAWRLSYAEFMDVPLEQWPVRAAEVQVLARGRVPELVALLEAFSATPKSKRAKGVEAVIKSLKKQIDGLNDMIAGDPSRATTYAKEDATATLGVHDKQEVHATYLKDQYRQARAYFALYLQSAWGLRTDAAGVETLKKAIEAELEELTEELIEEGLVRANGSRDTKAAKARMIAVCKAAGIPVIRTDAHVSGNKPCPSQCSCGKANCRDMGRKKDHSDIYEDFDHPEYCTEHVGLDKDACEAVAEYDDVFEDYANFTTLNKVLSNDLVALAGGVLYPVHTRYGWAGTGRSSSAKPNIQNQSKREGIREAFIARDGYVFIECDYPQLELYTLAQCCVSWFGHSRLAEVLLSGKDPHLMVAATMLRLSYDDARAIYKDAKHAKHALVVKLRQQAKPFNFGKPGGMGARTLIKTTRKQMGRKEFAKLELTETRAVELGKEWEATWPEAKPYFKRVEELINDSGNGRATVETLFTGRIRGNATFCATANNGFQALGADCAKNGVWLLAKASYVERESPLFNTRPNAFVHDENIAETPYAPDRFGIDVRAHKAAFELGKLMADGANAFLPDVPIAHERMVPVMMRRWFKKAESVFANPETGEWSHQAQSGWLLVPAKVIKDANDKDIVVADVPAAA